MTRMTPTSEQGSVTVFVTIITVALIFMAGLVVDGGQILNARRQATNIAESAARAGAQQLDETAARRDGITILNQQQAARRARVYLASSGRTGSVATTSVTVTVTVRLVQPLLILGLGGLGDVTVTGTGTATPIRGITQANP